jgi:phage/plasmid-like protein (TIGR03299 family)
MDFIGKSVYSNLVQLQEDCQSKEQVLVAGGLNYTVAKIPLISHYRDIVDGKVDMENMSVVEYPFHSGVVRTDTRASLGVVGSKYGLVQNAEVLQITDTFAKEGTARYVAAGAPNLGERIYLVMDTGHTFTLGDGELDKVRNFFFLTSSHNGSTSIVGYPAPVFMRDGSVLIFPDARHGAIKIRHTKNALAYVAQAHKLLSKIMDYWQKFTEVFILLRDCQITNAQAEYFLEEVYQSEDGDSKVAQRVRTEIFEAYTTGSVSSMPYARGTLLGLYLACAHHADNASTIRKSKKQDAEAAALFSRLMGTQAAHKAEALAFCMQLRKKLA